MQVAFVLKMNRKTSSMSKVLKYAKSITMRSLLHKEKQPSH